VRSAGPVILTAVLVTLLAAPAASATPRQPRTGAAGQGLAVPTRQGDAYCFRQAVTLNGVRIAGNRCYTFYALNTRAGAFLGVGPAGPPMVPPGQLVRLNTPAGAKHRGRLFYQIPLRTRVVGVPVDVLQFVTVQFSLAGGRLIFAVPWGEQVHRMAAEGWVPEGPRD
jgi:hypothetical protein